MYMERCTYIHTVYSNIKPSAFIVEHLYIYKYI